MSDLIAVIAPGEMGAGIGQRLRERGARVITSLADRSAASAQRAERAGMVAVASDDEIAAADMILSVVPPGDAAGLAERLKPAIARAAQKPFYVDCNAVAPPTAEAIGAILAGSGASYVDGGIIGAPPTPTTAGARLYVSGERAKDVMRLNSLGLDTRRLRRRSAQGARGEPAAAACVARPPDAEDAGQGLSLGRRDGGDRRIP